MFCRLLFVLNSKNVTEGSEKGQNNLINLHYDCFGASIVEMYFTESMVPLK